MIQIKDDSRPLVSVTVITYNSSKTVLETLESIKAQTYQNLELIVSDDCSQDDTVAVCNCWLEKNKDRFVRSEVITVSENTGTAANCNRAVKACQGVFQKLIAGDDLLEPDCIQINVDSIGDADFALSDMILFDDEKELGKTSNGKMLYALAHLAPAKRLKMYCRTMIFMNPPSEFLRLSLYEKIGLFDEELKILEDVTFFYNLLKSDARIVYIDKVTVRYRNSGISHSPESSLRLQKLLITAYNVYLRSHLSQWNLIDALTILDFYFYDLAIKSKNMFMLKAYKSRYNCFRKFRLWLINITMKPVD